MIIANKWLKILLPSQSCLILLGLFVLLESSGKSLSWLCAAERGKVTTEGLCSVCSIPCTYFSHCIVWFYTDFHFRWTNNFPVRFWSWAFPNGIAFAKSQILRTLNTVPSIQRDFQENTLERQHHLASGSAIYYSINDIQSTPKIHARRNPLSHQLCLHHTCPQGRTPFPNAH